MQGETPERDGRRRRSADSKRRIVEAMLELVREGSISPSADEVAARAGVGRRTVFRLFSDMEGIYTEMQAIMRDQVAPVRALPLLGDTPTERLHALIDRRVLFLEQVMPVALAAGIHRHHSPQLQADHLAIQTELRAILFDVLGKDLAPDPTSREALDAILSIDMWRRLRLEQGQSPAAAAQLLHRMTDALLQAE
ncbi:TetR/AcrR family transcriptional regulator [Sandaracinobacter neustonicus]|nr:TetR/AcrR family transcriptional regulator [Sandaracinobacter neustonicus]